MKLVCPACGATVSFEAWANDANCRLVMAELVTLPIPLPDVTIRYISLFRPGKRSLGWSKVLRLIKEVKELTTSGQIKIQGQPTQICPPYLWAEAMDMMVGQRDTLNLPMPNHNYLRKVAYDLATRKQHRSLRKGEEKEETPPPQQKQQSTPSDGNDEMTDEKWATAQQNISRITEMARKIGNTGLENAE